MRKRLKGVLHPSQYERGKIRRIYWKRTTGTLIYICSYEGGSCLLWVMRIPGKAWEEPVHHHSWKAIAQRLDRAPLLDTIYQDNSNLKRWSAA